VAAPQLHRRLRRDPILASEEEEPGAAPLGVPRQGGHQVGAGHPPRDGVTDQTGQPDHRRAVGEVEAGPAERPGHRWLAPCRDHELEVHGADLEWGLHADRREQPPDGLSLIHRVDGDPRRSTRVSEVLVPEPEGGGGSAAGAIAPSPWVRRRASPGRSVRSQRSAPVPRSIRR